MIRTHEQLKAFLALHATNAIAYKLLAINCWRYIKLNPRDSLKTYWKWTFFSYVEKYDISVWYDESFDNLLKRGIFLVFKVKMVIWTTHECYADTIFSFCISLENFVFFLFFSTFFRYSLLYELLFNMLMLIYSSKCSLMKNSLKVFEFSKFQRIFV